MLDFGTDGQKEEKITKKKENTCKNSSSVGKALCRMEKKQGRIAVT